MLFPTWICLLPQPFPLQWSGQPPPSQQGAFETEQRPWRKVQVAGEGEEQVGSGKQGVEADDSAEKEVLEEERGFAEAV